MKKEDSDASFFTWSGWGYFSGRDGTKIIKDKKNADGYPHIVRDGVILSLGLLAAFIAYSATL